MTKICKKCETPRELLPNGKFRRCRTCHNNSMKQEKHKQKQKEYQKEYYKTERYKALRKAQYQKRKMRTI